LRLFTIPLLSFLLLSNLVTVCSRFKGAKSIQNARTSDMDGKTHAYQK